MFRPCIDLHQGKVKQIVGATLREGASPVTNFETDRSAGFFAEMYQRDGLAGGHVIMLGPGNEAAARQALGAYPGGLQVGGGICLENGRAWIEAGASHAIVTSYVFREGQIDWDRLEALARTLGVGRLVLDLSCTKREGRYYIVTDRWQKMTQVDLSAANLERLARYAAEFLVHAADVEGKQGGVDAELIALLAERAPIPTTYAGGVRSLDDLRVVWEEGRGRLGATVGSALDIFGGPLPYRRVVEYCRKLSQGSAAQ